jgi:hypothetical protein
MTTPTNPLAKNDSTMSSSTKEERQVARLTSAKILALATLDAMQKEQQAGRLRKGTTRITEIENLLHSVIKFCDDNLAAEHAPLDEEQQRALCQVMHFLDIPPAK